MDFRTAKRLVDGQWTPCTFEELMPGDRFRLYEKDACVFEGTAKSAPVPCTPEGNMAIKCSYEYSMPRAHG